MKQRFEIYNDTMVSMPPAYSAIKAGITAGQEIQSLARPIAKLFDGIEDANNRLIDRLGTFGQTSDRNKKFKKNLTTNQIFELYRRIAQIKTKQSNMLFENQRKVRAKRGAIAPVRDSGALECNKKEKGGGSMCYHL